MSTRHLFCAAAALGMGLVLPSSARAEPRTHDGFYFQGALGGGFLTTTVNSGGVERTTSGSAATGSLWIGGTPAAGLVIGGGTFSSVAAGPTVKYAGGGVTAMGTASSDASLNLNMLGPFIDYYINPHQGFHLQAMLAVAALSWKEGDTTSADKPTGVGVMAGVGYDWWVGDEWSIGVLGRFAYAATSLNGVSYPTVAPGLLATFTFH